MTVKQAVEKEKKHWADINKGIRTKIGAWTPARIAKLCKQIKDAGYHTEVRPHGKFDDCHCGIAILGLDGEYVVSFMHGWDDAVFQAGRYIVEGTGQWKS